MKVVLATGPMAPEPGGVPLTTAPGALAAEEVAAALAQGWRSARPADELVLAPLSDGGPGCAATLPAAAVAARQELAGTSPLGEPRTAVLLELAGTTPPRRSGEGGAARTWLLDAAGLLALPAAPRVAAQEALTGSTAGLGQVLRQALAMTGPGDRLIIGLARGAVHDGGAGVLEALGGPASALERAAGRDLVLALADTSALSGLSGAGQGLTATTTLTGEQAQERDRQAAAAASAAVADLLVHLAARDAGAGDAAGAGEAGGGSPARTRRSLLPGAEASGGVERLTPATWGTGAAGGAALVLRALGARALPGSRVMADLTGLADQIDLASGTELVVTAAGEVYDVLADSVPAVVGEAAGVQALPAVLVCSRGLVPRGELAQAGISAVYSLSDLPGPGEGGREEDGAASGLSARPRDVVTALWDLGARLARSWSR